MPSGSAAGAGAPSGPGGDEEQPAKAAARRSSRTRAARTPGDQRSGHITVASLEPTAEVALHGQLQGVEAEGALDVVLDHRLVPRPVDHAGRHLVLGPHVLDGLEAAVLGLLDDELVAAAR